MPINSPQMRMLFVPSDAQGGAFYRMQTPASTLQESGYAHTLCHMMTYDEESIKSLNPDVIVFQHPTTDREIQVLRNYRRALPKAHFVYDIDDNWLAVPDESAHKQHLPKDIKARIVNAANLCNSITVTTEPLKKVMQGISSVKDIRVLPNYIPANTLQNMTRTRKQYRTGNKKIRVGWAGGIGHGGDIKLLDSLLYKLHDTVDWVFMGMTPETCDPRLFEIHAPVDVQMYHAKLASLNLDVALAPLANNDFNVSKSNLRVLEYGAAGIAVLASAIEPYNSFENIQKLPFVADVWEAAIRNLANNLDLVDDMAEKLHEDINQNWNASDHVEEIFQAYAPKKSNFHIPRSVVEESEEFTVIRGDLSEVIDGSNLFWLSANASMPLDFSNFAFANNNASCSVMSNDGIYPVTGDFTPLTNEIADDIRTAQNSAGNPAAIEIPHPTGPAVFLNKNALAKIGLPDTNRFPDRAAALLDWGARASSLGFNHSLDLNKFAHAAQTSATKETGEQLILANGWNPFFTQQIKESKHTEALNFAAQNIELTFNNIAYKQPFANQSYEDWHKINKPMTAKSKAVMESTMAGRSNFPKFSIIMPVFNTPIQELKSAIDSVQSQVYPNWELIIVDDASTNEDIRLFLNEYESSEQIRIERRSENGHICQASNDAIAVATGDWMLCLDHDDTVEPYALYMLASEIVANENLVFIYSDSDKISPDGKLVDPYFTPDFNYDLLLAQNYVTHLSAYKLDIVKGIGGYRKGYEGSQDWDLTLRYLTATGNIQGERSGIKHIPHVLYHWRQSKDSVSANIMNKPYARQAGIQAVADHLKETKQNCSITPHNIVPIFNMVRFLLPKDQPKASIIIQTKDNHEQLGICVNSILEKTAYNNYEIIVMDNGWRKDALKNIKKNDKVKLFSASGPFNYAKTNNTGADYASGEFLCFLNDDTQIIESSWLLDLVALAARPWTGAVGPRLLYPDGHVQQAGTIIDLSMPAGQKAIHAFQREQVASPGVGGRGVLAAEWSAVTGACLVIEKRKYQEMNGMDANQFPLDYNDVDLCLRLMKAGYKNVCAGHIIVLHHEGMSKKKNKKTFTDEQVIDSESAFAKRHEGFVDPYLNANQQFHPHLRAILTAPPQLPFNESIERESMLVINGGHKEAIALYFDDVKAFCMNANGHTLGFSYPRMDRVAILDSRDSPSDLLYICHMLGISKILMNGIGNSTYGLIDYLLEAEKYGIEVIYHFVESEKEERLPDEIKAFIWAKARKIDLAALEAEVDNADAA